MHLADFILNVLILILIFFGLLLFSFLYIALIIYPLFTNISCALVIRNS